MGQRIVGFHQDNAQHWVAELECGHNQHVRHDPPWTNRPPGSSLPLVVAVLSARYSRVGSAIKGHRETGHQGQVRHHPSIIVKDTP
jgi:Protein of unknown function (DUF3565)